MKAVVLDAPQQMRFRTKAADPILAADETLVRVDAVGICGSDLHVYRGIGQKRDPGLILGHEICGEAISGPLEGKRVTVNPIIHCGKCEQCVAGNYHLCAKTQNVGFNRQGAYAEYVAVPTSHLIEVAGNMSNVRASLTEPAAVCLHAITLAQNAMPRLLRESKSIVIGAGAIGLFGALWLRALGCQKVEVVDTNEVRRATVNKAGFKAVEPSGVSEARYELVMDCVGSSATRQLAINAAKARGVIVHVGFQEHDGNFPAAQLTRKEVQLIGSFCSLPRDLNESLAALQSGALGSLDWVEERPLKDAPQAFVDLCAGLIAAPKIVLLPSG